MKAILNQLFDSNEFWREFKLKKESSDKYGCSMLYKYKTKFSNRILLKFFESEGVKSVSIIENRKEIVECIFFLNLDELTFILNRVAAIRAANPLCIGSQSIKSLSCSQ